MNLDLGNVLSRAWKITWNNKILWLFGVLAGLGSGGGGGGGGNSGFRYSGGPSDYPSGGPQLPPQVERWFSDLQQGAPTIIAIIVGVICLLFLISLVVFVLSLLGQGGLIGGVRVADSKGSITFGEAWELGTRYAWRLFLVNLPAVLLGLLIFLIAIIAAVAVIGMVGAGAAARGDIPNSAVGGLIAVAACVAPLICLLGLGGVVLRIFIFFARFPVVLEDLAPMAAFRRAWEIFVANLGSILILGVILVVLSWIFGFVIALPMVLAVLPVALGIIGTAATGQAVSLAAGGIFALVCCAVYLPILLVLQGIYETWATSAWTLAYLQFIGPRMAGPVLPASVYPLPPDGASA